MEKNPYIELAECLLSEEMVEYFEVVMVEKTLETLDVTLEERDNGFEGYKPVSFVQMDSMRKASFVIIRSEDARCRSISSGGAGWMSRQAKASAGAGI